jgi:type IV pilus assembly protein PilA
MLQAIRRRVQDEKGFTLIELLVVILIIGILAAIAIPSFISQKDKANDAAAKSYVRNEQTAEETYYTDNNGYANTLAALVAIEATLNQYPGATTPPDPTVSGNSYTVSATSKSGVTYTIARATNGTTTRTCSPAGTGGCGNGSTW